MSVTNLHVGPLLKTLVPLSKYKITMFKDDISFLSKKGISFVRWQYKTLSCTSIFFLLIRNISVKHVEDLTIVVLKPKVVWFDLRKKTWFFGNESAYFLEVENVDCDVLIPI